MTMKTEVMGTRRKPAKSVPMPTSAKVPTVPVRLGKKWCSIAPMPPPNMAPMKRVGANMPPGVPLRKEIPVARIFTKARMRRSFQANWPWSAWSIAG